MCYKQEVQERNRQILKSHTFNEIPEYVQEFLFNNITSERAKITYLNTIKLFLNWCLLNKYILRKSIKDISCNDLGELKTVVFTKYFTELQENEVKISTINTKIKQLKSFFKYLSYNDYINKDYIQGMSKSKFKFNNTSYTKEVKLPSEKDILEMMQKIQGKNKHTFTKERDITIIETFINTGLRLSELVGLDVGDIYINETPPYLKVVGKGLYTVEEAEKVYLNERIVNILQRWMWIRDNYLCAHNTKALFLTTKANRISEIAVHKIITVNSSKKITPHMLRHYYATKLYDETKDILYVKEQLRHKNVALTANVYANGQIKL